MLWLPGDWLDQSADMLAAGAADGRALVRAQGERLPLAGRLLSTSWGTVGDFLGPSIEHFYAVHSQAKLECKDEVRPDPYFVLASFSVCCWLRRTVSRSRRSTRTSALPWPGERSLSLPPPTRSVPRRSPPAWPRWVRRCSAWRNAICRRRFARSAAARLP